MAPAVRTCASAFSAGGPKVATCYERSQEVRV